MDAEQLRRDVLSRRSALRTTAGATFLLSQAGLFERLVQPPPRLAPHPAAFPDIQFALDGFISPPRALGDGAGAIMMRLPPVFALFLPARLGRTPSRADQDALARALATIEWVFPPSPSGVLISSVSYGLPYFRRLRASLVRAHMPTLLRDRRRPVLEEARPFPTDVAGGLVGGPGAVIPGLVKDRFNVNVVIESSDLLFHLRSDSMTNLSSVALWLQGSNTLGGRRVPSPSLRGLLSFQAPRIQFVQQGLPRRLAEQAGFEFAGRMNPESPMAMGFADQQVDSSGPAAITTFAGSPSARLTSARAGDYFDNGSIAHFSHVIQDLFQFYGTANQDSRHSDGEPFTERVQYMFRSNQLGTDRGIPAAGNRDQFTDGGGPAFIGNVFQGTDAAVAAARDSAGFFFPGNAVLDATFNGSGRIGHEAALQRTSRAPDGTPLHIRSDGPGLDSMDVPAFEMFPRGARLPAGSRQFKLQFLIHVPTADTFAQMRISQAAQDLEATFGVGGEDNGLERFLTATRRQNFLVPPRRHRSFPLVELA